MNWFLAANVCELLCVQLQYGTQLHASTRWCLGEGLLVAVFLAVGEDQGEGLRALLRGADDEPVVKPETMRHVRIMDGVATGLGCGGFLPL
jgi:hypothetical protein